MIYELRTDSGIVAEIAEGVIVALRRYEFQHERAAIQTNRALLDAIIAGKVHAGKVVNGRVTVSRDDL